MAEFLIDDGATITCTHGGQVSITTTNTRVKAGGQYLTTLSDTFTVSGCAFQVPVPGGTKPQPCVSLQWVVPATRVFINGTPALVKTSTGLCQSAEQIPQGAPNVVVTQFRAKGT